MSFNAPRIDLNWYGARICYIIEWWVKDLQ
jgi:hypothetical protein